MRNFTNTILALGVLASIVGLGATQAKAGFVFNGSAGAPPPGTVFEIKLINQEVVLDARTPAFGSPGGLNGDPVHDDPIVDAHKIPGGLLTLPGQQLYGIFTITSINNQSNGDQYWVPSATQHLQGEFFGYTAKSVTAAGTASEQVNFTGGGLKVFFSSSADYNAIPGPFKAAWTDIAASNGVGSAGQSLFLAADGVGGILPDSGLGADTSVTLQSQFHSFSATRFTGVGDGFLTVTFSSDLNLQTDALDGNTSGPLFPYPGNQDLSLKSNFDSHPAGSPAGALGYQNQTGWSLHSDDPVIGQIQSIPEPGSMLMWAGLTILAGVGAIRRKKA